jgi:hypothetical protein
VPGVPTKTEGHTSQTRRKNHITINLPTSHAKQIASFTEHKDLQAFFKRAGQLDQPRYWTAEEICR